jgi:hypothetical protein
MTILYLQSPNAPIFQNITTPQKWENIRAYRAMLLQNSDWTQLPDAALSPEDVAAWQNYRQSLRDVPQDYGNPDDVIFPTPPGGA